MKILSNWLDFLFPPLCLACRERCETKFLCASCWRLCELPDPAERCRHCFEELDQRGSVCKQCSDQRLIPIERAYVFDPESPAHYLGVEWVEAMASFAVLQWIYLEWPIPDVIVPMPDNDSFAIGRAFAAMLRVPFVQALRKNCEYVDERLEEDLICLLFDVSNSLENLQKSAHSLSLAFPKRNYLLSLLPYVDCVS